MDTISSRLMFFRTKIVKKSRKDFCVPLIMTESELKNIEYGKTDLKEKHIRQIGEAYGVRKEWLLTGEEPIQKEENVATQMGEIVAMAAHNNPEDARRFFSRLCEDFSQAEILLIYELFRRRFPRYDHSANEDLNTHG